MSRLFVTATILAVLCLPAQAQEKTEASKPFEDCMDKVDLGAMKNSQWASCYTAELARQDKVLNAEYRALQGRIPAETRDMLVKGQRGWIAFREAWCRLEAELPNAPGGQVNYLACMVEQTAAQIKKLKDVY